MTYPGAPSIYYGDEIGMEGRHDPGCRGGFPWDEHEWDQGLREYVRCCIALRKAKPALRRGDLTWLWAGQGAVAYGRRLEAETLLVLLNSSRQRLTVDLPVGGYLDDGTELHDVWRDERLTVSQGLLERMEIPPRVGTVLEA